MDILKTWGRIPSQHLGLLFAVGMASAFLPVRIYSQRVISFSQPLIIHTSKAEPPRVAFDLLLSDARNDVKSFAHAGDSLTTVDLSISHPSTRGLGVADLYHQKVILPAMVFTREEIKQSTEQASTERQNEDRLMSALSPQEQRRLLEANRRFEVLRNDWTPPTFQELAEQKIREIKDQKLQTEQAGNQKIFVAAQNSQGQVLTPAVVHTADVQVRAPGRGDSPNNVHGNLRYKDALPSGPQWKTTISQYADGVKRGEGRYLADGKFEIPVDEKSGTLVAQVQDQSTGQVIGEGTLRLSEMTGTNPTIEIRKSVSQIAVNFSSFYNHTQKLISEPTAKDRGVAASVYFASLDHQEQTDQLGSAQIDQVLKGSWSLVRSEAENYYPGIFLVRSGEEKQLPLFPSKMVQALKQIIHDQARFSQFDENGSVVWGQIVRGGQPIAGAQVSIESDEGYQPIYFNSLLIPDPSLKATSENGYFVVMNLSPGFHSLLASQAGIYLSHANVVTDENAISVADMTSSMDRDSVSLRVFDAFTGAPQQAEMEMQSLPQAVNVQGYATVNLSLKHQMSFAQVHPSTNQYVDTLLLYDDASDHVHAPLVRADWLNSIQLERKINIDPEAGIVIGFVPSIDFEVYLPNDAHYLSDQIVYFDANGAIVDHGVAGGGFLLFNVKAGVQSVVVGDKNSEMLQTQVIPMDAGATVTLQYR